MNSALKIFKYIYFFSPHNNNNDNKQIQLNQAQGQSDYSNFGGQRIERRFGRSVTVEEDGGHDEKSAQRELQSQVELE